MKLFLFVFAAIAIEPVFISADASEIIGNDTLQIPDDTNIANHNLKENTSKSNSSESKPKGNMMYLALISGVSSESTGMGPHAHRMLPFHSTNIEYDYGSETEESNNLNISGWSHDFCIRITMSFTILSYLFTFYIITKYYGIWGDVRSFGVFLVSLSFSVSAVIILLTEINYDATSDDQSLLYYPKNPPHIDPALNESVAYKESCKSVGTGHSSLRDAIFQELELSNCHPSVYTVVILISFTFFLSIPRGLPSTSLLPWCIGFLFIILLYNTRHLSHLPTLGGEVYHFFVFSCSSIGWVYALSHYSVLSFGHSISFFVAICITCSVLLFLVIYDFKKFFHNIGLFSIINIVGNVLYLAMYIMFLYPAANKNLSSQKKFLKDMLKRIVENRDELGHSSIFEPPEDHEPPIMSLESPRPRSMSLTEQSFPIPRSLSNPCIDLEPNEHGDLSTVVPTRRRNSHNDHEFKGIHLTFVPVGISILPFSQFELFIDPSQIQFHSTTPPGSLVPRHRTLSELSEGIDSVSHITELPDEPTTLPLTRTLSDQHLSLRSSSKCAKKKSKNNDQSRVFRPIMMFPVQHLIPHTPEHRAGAESSSGITPKDLLCQSQRVLDYYYASFWNRLVGSLMDFFAFFLRFPSSMHQTRERDSFLSKRKSRFTSMESRTQGPRVFQFGSDPLVDEAEEPQSIHRSPIIDQRTRSGESDHSDGIKGYTRVYYPPVLTLSGRSRLLNLWDGWLESNEMGSGTSAEIAADIYAVRETLNELLRILHSLKSC